MAINDKKVHLKIAIRYTHFLKLERDDASFPSAERPSQILALLRHTFLASFQVFFW